MESTSRILYDDFRNFRAGGPGCKWSYFAAEGHVGNAGIEHDSSDGLRVIADGTNPDSGEPAFSNTVAQEGDRDNPERMSGGLDHVKWLVYSSHESSHGFPGFDAHEQHELAFEMKLGGRTFGTARHPFGAAVDDAEDDIRLASFALSTIDVETFVVFDFFMTNKSVYAFYERLPYARARLGNYASFSYALKVADNEPGRINQLRIAYDKSRNRVRWQIDGREVFSVERLGCRLDRRHMTIDHGGEEREVSLEQLNMGFGLFSLLDGRLPSGSALCRLSSAPDFYFDPARGAPHAQRFADEHSRRESRLFGQGAELVARDVVVASHPIG